MNTAHAGIGRLHGLHNLVIKPHTSIAALTRHPSYASAKSGNHVAAAKVALCFIRTPLLDGISSDMIFVPVIAIEKTGYNAIPLQFARLCAFATGATVERNIIQAVKAFHTGASALDRFLRKVSFDGPVKAGASYVIADDVSTSGATLMALHNHIQQNGGHVVAAVALALARDSAQLTITDKTIHAINSKFGTEFITFIAEYGYTEITQLSESQGKYLLKFNSVDSIRETLPPRLGRTVRGVLAGLSAQEQDFLRRWSHQGNTPLTLSGLSSPASTAEQLQQSLQPLRFHCSSCGVCCTKLAASIDQVKQLKRSGVPLNPLQQQLADFPYPALPDGSCSQLNALHQCRVYDNRPAVCNVEKTYELIGIPAGVSQREYYELTGKLCNQWQDDAGIPELYRVQENYAV